MERWRFWAEQLLSKKSLATAGAAAAGLVGWATTHNPAFAWLMLGGGGAWTALMYYLAAAGRGDVSPERARAAAVREVERALKQFPMPGTKTRAPAGESARRSCGASWTWKS